MPRNSPLSIWFETASAMNAAALTIGARMAGFAADAAAGRKPSAEATRMIAEKQKAAIDGAFALHRAYGALYWRWWRSLAVDGPVAATRLVAGAAPGAVMAGARPGFAKARANARRLSGKAVTRRSLTRRR